MDGKGVLDPILLDSPFMRTTNDDIRRIFPQPAFSNSARDLKLAVVPELTTVGLLFFILAVSATILAVRTRSGIRLRQERLPKKTYDSLNLTSPLPH